MTQFLMGPFNLPGCVAAGLSTSSLVIDKSKKDIICGVIFLSRVDGIIVILIVTICMAFTLLYLSSAMLGFSLSCKDCLHVKSLSFSCVCKPGPSGFIWKSQYLAKTSTVQFLVLQICQSSQCFLRHFTPSCKIVYLCTFFKPIFPSIIRETFSCVFVVVSFLFSFGCSALFFLLSCITLICWRLSTTHVAFMIPCFSILRQG